MKKILFILSAILLFAACSDSKEDPIPTAAIAPDILGYWVFTETYMGSVYTESLHFYDTGEFTHYGDETDWLGNEGRYLYNPGRGTLQLLYSASGELNNYLISIAGTQMTLRYIDEEDGPEEPMIFTRMGE
mgnify:CR=1 FL=1